MRKINSLIFHCSDSEDSLDLGVREIRDWHVNGNGWSDIGYHYVIRRNGQVEAGRSVDQIGAHVFGYNSDSIGVCWVGCRTPSPMQWSSLLKLGRNLRDLHKIPVEKVFGHYELDGSKTCPNIDMDLLRAELIFKD